jgi:hypothetical protein
LPRTRKLLTGCGKTDVNVWFKGWLKLDTRDLEIKALTLFAGPLQIMWIKLQIMGAWKHCICK